MSELKTYNKKIILVDKWTADNEYKPCVNRVIRLDNPRDLSEFFGSSLEEIIQLIGLEYPNSYMWIGELTEDLPNELIYDKSIKGVRAMNDREKVELLHQKVEEGQKLVGDKLVTYDVMYENIDENGVITRKSRDELIRAKVITLESEKEKARAERDKAFRALDLYDLKIVRGDLTETKEMKANRDAYRLAWLELPNNYVDITVPIETLYPETPATVHYFE